MGTDTYYWERFWVDVSEGHNRYDFYGWEERPMVAGDLLFDPGEVLFTPDQSFEYRVAAVYDSGKWSPWSEVVHVKP